MMTRRKRTEADTAALPAPPPLSEGVESAADAVQRPVDWLWRGAIPAYCYTLIQGRKGTGKSTILAAVVASATGGPVVPDWVGPRDAGVVWYGEERQWESVVVPRLALAGAALPWVRRLAEQRINGVAGRLTLPRDLDTIREIFQATRTELLIVDPISSLASPGIDLNNPQQARLFCQSLSDLCWESKCSCVATQHIKKGNAGDPVDAGYGSAEIANISRSVLRADHHPHLEGQLVLAHVAGNAGTPMPTQSLRLIPASEDLYRIEWLGASDIDADTIAEGRGNEAERDEWHDADALLAAVIGSMWVRVGEIMHRAESAGITPRMLRRAKARLRLPSRQRMSGADHFWEWGPPALGWPLGMEVAGGPETHAHTRERLGVNGVSDPPKNPTKKGTRPTRPRVRTRPPSDPLPPQSEEVSHEP